ncbi:Crp/Fnr family transcriptional regulator [Chitinophaga sp. OAE865]|uniref:Crp/Fnr family transcriptional regulator n=1 Tax=Chitinophaga sp. OAE865 TaxID=2817898 RepID=UPI001AEABA95
MFDAIFAVISQFITISPELQSDLDSKLKTGTYTKRSHLLKQGQVSNYLYFVTKGLLRAYCINDAGDEVNSWFMKENDFLISVLSFYSRLPSQESIEVLEDCEVIFIHHDDLKELYNKHTEFNIVGRRLTERYYCQSELRLSFMRGLSAGYRYKMLLQNYPELVKRVPSKYIASYLGMTVYTLSRMRKAVK